MNPYEANARNRKASALADAIWGAASDERRRDVQLPWEVSRGDDGWWAIVAEQARVKLPSEETRAAVVVELSKRVNAQRRGATDDCNDCGGSGTENVRIYGRDGDSYMDGERDCDSCHATGKASCEDCRSAAAKLAVPTGFFCEPCTAKTWPEIARHARMILDPFAGLTENDAATGRSQPPLESARDKRRVG